MSAKRTLFPPRPGGEREKTVTPEDFFEDPDWGGLDQAEAPFSDAAGHQSAQAAKGRAAYAAQEDLPPFDPTQGGGFGAAGGLYVDDPMGHGKDAVASPSDMLSIVSDEALRAECDKRFCHTCPSKKEGEEARLRALADLDNAKKRLDREREEQRRYAAESVLHDIIPSLDNLELALRHADRNACKDFVVGVEMTLKLLQEALAKHGLARVGQVGEEFNPGVHEAVGAVDSADTAPGHICQLLSSGYTLGDRLLRPAKVMVCKK